MPGNTAPPPSGNAEMALETCCVDGEGLDLDFLVGGSMEPKRKSFSVVVVAAAVDGVDLRFPRGKACFVMVLCFVG